MQHPESRIQHPGSSLPPEAVLHQFIFHGLVQIQDMKISHYSGGINEFGENQVQVTGAFAPGGGCFHTGLEGHLAAIGTDGVVGFGFGQGRRIDNNTGKVWVFLQDLFVLGGAETINHGTTGKGNLAFLQLMTPDKTPFHRHLQGNYITGFPVAADLVRFGAGWHGNRLFIIDLYRGVFAPPGYA